jgi:hypothetical protein
MELEIFEIRCARCPAVEVIGEEGEEHYWSWVYPDHRKKKCFPVCFNCVTVDDLEDIPPYNPAEENYF